jgi:hypothetical protein
MSGKRERRCVSASLAVALAGGLLVACAIEEGVNLSSEEEEALLEEPADVLDGEADVTIQAGCSMVRWCNRPSSFDGTVCQQTACSRLAAVAECREDVEFVCGEPVCPWIFTSTTGARQDLCLR